MTQSEPTVATPEASETERKRQRAIERVAPSELARVLLQTSILPDEALVPCWPWKHGMSGTQPIMRAGDEARHPVKFLYPDSKRIKRVCADRRCCNPRHFVTVPRISTGIQHRLVFECEERIDDFNSLEEAYRGIPYPKIHVLEAWRNKIQLRLAHHDTPRNPREV